MNEIESYEFTVNDEDVLEAMHDTSRLCADSKVTNLTSSSLASIEAETLTNEVEFWKWMQRNYNKADIFRNSHSMQSYISQGSGQYGWMEKQMQGKGYEWDWIRKQRMDVRNMLNTYDAGDVANRASSDVTEHNILTGMDKEYQMKAYRGKTNPHLDNTPKDMTVVTNSEKVDIVKRNGYEDVQEFRDGQGIKRVTDKRMSDIENGKTQTAYTASNTFLTMAKAGIMGAVIGMGLETIQSYKKWKNGEITNGDYLTEILKAGGDTGLTAGITAGIMLPVSSVITVAGASSIISIPIAFVVSNTVNKIIAPCFGRGEYKKLLGEAKYYQSYNQLYNDMAVSIERSSKQFYFFVNTMKMQQQSHEKMKEISTDLNGELERLYVNI